MIAFSCKVARYLGVSFIYYQSEFPLFVHMAPSFSLLCRVWSFYMLLSLLHCTWERRFEHLIGEMPSWSGPKLQVRSLSFFSELIPVLTLSHIFCPKYSRSRDASGTMLLNQCCKSCIVLSEPPKARLHRIEDNPQIEVAWTNQCHVFILVDWGLCSFWSGRDTGWKRLRSPMLPWLPRQEGNMAHLCSNTENFCSRV